MRAAYYCRKCLPTMKVLATYEGEPGRGGKPPDHGYVCSDHVDSYRAEVAAGDRSAHLNYTGAFEIPVRIAGGLPQPFDRNPVAIVGAFADKFLP